MNLKIFILILTLFQLFACKDSNKEKTQSAKAKRESYKERITQLEKETNSKYLMLYVLGFSNFLGNNTLLNLKKNIT